MIRYFEFESSIEKIETILNQLNNNPLVNNVVISQPQKNINEC